VAGIGLHCRGLVDRDASRLLEAVAALRQGPRRLDLALACESAGALLAEQGRVQDGLALLDEAGAEYRRLGATRDAKRVAGIPSALGVRPRPRQSRRRPAVGWEALTRTEQRVVELASQGLTNPQIGKRLFISRRTVGTHLSHVFAKLEVSSRVELAAMIREARATGSEV
jgi:DNA-binding CsgD family transcriptional regulator